MWRSLVARSVRVGEVPSSNLGTPIVKAGLALGLASLCASFVLAAAGCGSSSSAPQPMPNYGSLANAVCGKLTTQAGPTAGMAARIKAVDAARAGLEQLVPPSGVKKIYNDLVTRFADADHRLTVSGAEIARLAARLRTHPNDKAASAKYRQLAAPIGADLHDAAADARTLGLGRCVTAFGGG